MSDEKPLPAGRLGRLARLARAGARAGVDLLGRSDGAVAAEQASRALGQLRGLAAKVGQMASYVDGLVPESRRDQYERWMTTLQANASTSSSAAIRARVVTELGGPVEASFAAWDDEPMASASIGQVHRARLPDGREVAVKVQHPGIEVALESDLRNAKMFEGTLARMAGMRKFNSDGVLDEIRERFREELDYGLEADRMQRFGALFEGDPRVRIPRVIRSHCTPRVLTAELVTGLDFAAARTQPEAQRRAWCETLWKFVYRSNLVGGLFNADPHPGNYVFQPDGAIAFLDFGCVQPIAEEHRLCALSMHRAAHDRDARAFVDAVRRLLQLRGGRYEPRALDYVQRCFRPLWESPFRVTRPYVADLVNDLKGVVLDFRRSRDDGFVPLPQGTFFLNRMQFGFYSVLARLDAEVDYTAVERTFLAEVRG
jgi:predicted unusual protein kinase regulating ubiquinone biosynthesis (AarF/ABC1/UbiB family)